MLTEEETNAIPRVLIYGILSVIVVAMVTFLWLSMKPTMLDMEREARTHSQQYVTAQLTAIMNDMEQCALLKREMASLEEQGGYTRTLDSMSVQLDTLRARVEHKLTTIPSSEHPTSNPCE